MAKFNAVPIVIYSTSQSLTMADRAEELKADAFLTKPSSHKLLEIKLQKILSTAFLIPSDPIFSHDLLLQ